MSKPLLLILNGPNLNFLGTREPHIYGQETLADVEKLVRARATELGYDVDFFQTNHEGVMLDHIQSFRGKAAGVVINPGAWTHTSVALRDCLLSIDVPFVEVHVTNVHKREPFRHHSYLSDVAEAVIAGAGVAGWSFGVDILANKLSK